MSTETFHQGQAVYFLHPTESWIKGTVQEVVQTKLKSGAMETSYTCQGYPEKTLLPTIVGKDAIVSKLLPSSIHQVVNTGPTSDETGDAKGSVFLPDGRDTYSDLLDLSYLHDSTLLEQVRKRYFANLIYTRIGPIVLALNPYDYTLPNYVDTKMPTYIAEGKIIVANQGKSQLLPHAWSTAHYSYWLLSSGESTNQSVIVSGESGAGKTETAKIVVKYLGKVSTSQCTDAVRETATQVTARVNLTSPILEAFGNAKTARNDNSSRFGKFMKVHFSLPADGTGGVMVGVSIDVYLLEKSRVITHGDGERAYHCFYQLLSRGKSAEKEDLLKSLHLGAASDYDSLNIGKAIDIPGVDDSADWQEVVNAMTAVGLTTEEENSVWKVVATVLHLLSVKISAINHDECEIEGMDLNSSGSARKRSQSMAPGKDVPSADRAAKNVRHLEAVREIIGVDMNVFASELITTKSVIQGETIVRKLKKAAAVDVRDAICKYMYEALFLWLVGKINGLISPPSDAKDTWIALLDIFGFENFQQNSFEQMCINLANETLQNHYNSVVFTRDMAECHSEGINTASVTFYDNQPCLDMICGVNFSMCGVPGHKSGSIVTSKLSITSLLDDESSLGNGTDLSFCSKLEESFGAKGQKVAHPNFEKPKTQNNAFIIKHYAGDVKYTVDGFRSKNADTTKESLKELILSSPNGFVSGLVTHYQSVQQEAIALSQASGSGLKASNTVSGFFKNQLVRLMTEINRTHPHWIRCVKPHSAKKPRMFCGEEVMGQMRSAGVLETVRIRQQSFSIRLPFSEFLAGPASLFLKKMPQHTLYELGRRAAFLSEILKESQLALENAKTTNATPGKLKELTSKFEVAEKNATILNNIVNEIKASNGASLSGSPREQCAIILKRCGLDSHELAQVGVTKVFMRAPAFQQVIKQETEIRTGLSNILLAFARGRMSCKRTRCLQLNKYALTIGGCLAARSSAVIMRKKELIVNERDLITRFKDLLLKEAEEGRVREITMNEEEQTFHSLLREEMSAKKSLHEAWLAARSARDSEERHHMETNEASSRATVIETEFASRHLLVSLRDIFDDETEDRLIVEAEEEEQREGTLYSEALLLFEAAKEARFLAAKQSLLRCEHMFDDYRDQLLESYEKLLCNLGSEEHLKRAEVTNRSTIHEEESDAWERDIVYEHERGWEKQLLLWSSQQQALAARLVRLMLRHETNARAAIEVEYEQLLIGIYSRVDDSLRVAAEKEASRLEVEAAARYQAARQKQAAEAERYRRWAEEQREIAMAIWSAAKEAEDEFREYQRHKQAAFDQRLQEAERIRDRIRAQQEREVNGRGKGVRSSPVVPKVISIPKSFGSLQRQISNATRSLDTKLMVKEGSPEPTYSADSFTSGYLNSPSPMDPRNQSSMGRSSAGTAHDRFRLLMGKLQAISSAPDLTPRTRRALRLQLARGTDEVDRESSLAYIPMGVSQAFQDNSPIDVSSSVQLDHSHKDLMTRFDSGSSPLGRFRDSRSDRGGSENVNVNNFKRESESEGVSSLDDLSRRGIPGVSSTLKTQGKVHTPSIFHRVSINPFDCSWEPVAGGTKAYLPDGSLVEIS